MFSSRRFWYVLMLALLLGVVGMAVGEPDKVQGGGKESSAGPRCGEGWHEDELSVVEAAGYRVKVSSCSVFKDPRCSPKESNWIDPVCFKQNARVIDSEGHVVADFTGDDVEVVELAHPSVDLVLLVRKVGGSKHGVTYVLYFAGVDPRYPVTVDNAILTYQANRRKGSEYEPDGFYRDRDGQVLIDTLVRLPGDTSHAAAKYEVETLKLGTRSLSSLGCRAFDIESYRRYGEASEASGMGSRGCAE